MEKYRADFPALDKQRGNKPPIYLDNACTTLVPNQVINAMQEYYTDYPACNGGRSRHWFAKETTSRVEKARQVIADFINASSAQEIVFTTNTTHAINTVAFGFPFQPGDEVLLTGQEHNSNLLPWLKIQQTIGVKVQYLSIPLDLDELEKKLRLGRIKIFCATYTSNLTGYTMPEELIKEMTGLAHRYGALVLLDSAQTAPRHKIDVKHLDIDFLTFSLHKMCGPRGVGILYSKKELLDKTIEPLILGGGSVADAYYDSYTMLLTPDKFEGGTQNYPGQIAAGTAIEYLQNIGFNRIKEHETALNRYLSQELLRHYGDLGWFSILGPEQAEQRGGILTFVVKRPNAVGITDQLSDLNNIMIRDGAFCVHAYLNSLFGANWTKRLDYNEHSMAYRVSFYFYNTFLECDIFIDTLEQIFLQRAYIY